MHEMLKILDEDTLKLMKIKKAKPDKTILEHTEDLLNELDILCNLKYMKKNRIYDLITKAIVYHDLGKLNEEFQKRVNKKGARFNEEKEVVHNILSLFFIDRDNFENSEDYIRVAHSVFNHHHYCNNYDEMSRKEDMINSLLDGFNIKKFKKSLKSKMAGIVEDLDAVKIKGYLHKCDYSASSETIIEYPNNFLKEGMKNLLNEWKEHNKEASWNSLQQFCDENSDKNIIAIAQTGMGKTEAGLIWIGDNKGFFVLPIRTAINAIYDRVAKQILKNKEVDKKTAILHSSALEYYIKNIQNENEEIDIMNYYKIGRQLSIPLNISTMDSIFDFVFKYPGYELKIATLSYSKIVIDEIQAYGPDLMAYLIYGLEKAEEQGAKIAIVTATLPPFVKDLLKKNINFKENDRPFTNDIKRHKLKVLNKRLCYEDIRDTYIENKKNGKNNKILVVCNTIKEAQKLYEKLKESINDEELHILHSKFIRKERLEKEKEIIEFGKTYGEERILDNQNVIWISTSIVEASLDIDFDYLFTELQDLNSLFQRLGRCNRKGVKNVDDYNCYVYCEIEESHFINGNKGFIDKTLFKLSKEAVLSCDGVLSEEDKVNIINGYLTYDNLKNSDYMRKYNEVYDYIKKIPPYKFDCKEVDLRNILSEDIIPGPVYEKYLEDIKYIQMKLLDKSIDTFEKVKLKDKIMKYTVSVYLGDIDKYERDVRDGKAVSYKRISLSSFKNDYIKVIDCQYDEMGYRKAGDDSKSGSIIW